jgi:hypothetical protein
MKRRLLVIVALLGAVVGALAVRTAMEGHAALLAGDAAFDRGDVPEAIAEWEAAARWYLPGAPHVDDAYDRLAKLGVRAEASHDRARALTAWRAIRSASLVTRGAWSPHTADRAAADAAIARLEGSDADASPAAGDTPGAREAWQAAQLARDHRPAGGASLLAVLGIVAWLVGFGLLARRGLSAGGRVLPRQAALAGGIVVAGLACWAIGLYAV